MNDIVFQDFEAKEGYEYFVSVVDGARYGILLGPYATNEEALTNVQRGISLASQCQGYSWFYDYGTCGAPIGTITKTVFGR